MEKRTKIRWGILVLLFFATTINYVDRQIIGLLKPYIEKDLKWNEADYGYIVTAFQMAYAAGLLISGRLLDRFGLKIGYTLSIFVWSLGALLHAIAGSVLGFAFARTILGLGEAANFPAAVKTVTEWFPQKDRALATGIFNSGSNVGAIVAPIIVTSITVFMGWQWAFVITGSLGFIWMIFWLYFYHNPARHPRINDTELAYINAGQSLVTIENEAPVTWTVLFRYRSTYGICLSRFLTDWVWWFFLFWIPDFLNKNQHIDLKKAVLPLIIIYTFASAGGVFGGWLSSRLLRLGKSADYSRKTAILICALMVLPLSFAAEISNLWIVVIIIGMAAAAHQGWASNIFTIVSDVYPRQLVGTVIGLSGFAGAIGGALSATFVGLILQFTNSYFVIFIIASVMYLLAWVVIKLLIPRIKPISISGK